MTATPMTLTPQWTPPPERIERARITAYMRWLARERGLTFATYGELWQWSASMPGDFWRTIIDHFAIPHEGDAARALDPATMPGAQWFPDVRLNYVEQVFRHATPRRPALVTAREGEAPNELSWADLERQVAALAASLRAHGVTRGDRVAAYLPNGAEAVAAFLATASLGAIWSLCSPDMGAASVVDRFRQIEPKVLVATTGYRYGGKVFDRSDVVADIERALVGSLRLVIDVAPRNAESSAVPRLAWAEACAGDAKLAIERVPFGHPLWIVYSSGTTGSPKPIVHGHGGIVLEHVKLMALHNDLGPEDRYHWYSTTGWIMWNCQMGGLLVGATILVYDGNPAWPDAGALWRFARDSRATFVGAGAAFHHACMKAQVDLRGIGLAGLRTVGSTGSPLSLDGYAWLQRELGDDCFVNPISGGTDLASAFVGGNVTLPVYAGEMQGRCLGAAVEAWSAAGKPVVGEVGELVCTQPMPSMPLFFWNDPDGVRYRDSYFDLYPGVWRHGDWLEITERGGAIIYGRSDATINRGGVRMGTAELYGAVEALPEVQDSMAIDLEYLGRPSFMALFVVLRKDALLDAALESRIVKAIRVALSPRHVPNAIVAVQAIPRTLTGKKLEVPIKRLLLGEPLAKVVNRDAVANPECLAWYEAYAAARANVKGR